MGTRTTAPQIEPHVSSTPSVWVVRVLLVLIVSLSFAPTLDNGWMDLDDPQNFLENRDYRSLGWAQVKTAFTQDRLGVYQPIGSLILSVQYAIGGMNPRTYHAASLIFHVANALLLQAMIMALIARGRSDWAKRRGRGLAWSSGLAACLFAVHPLRVEAVAWATAQLYLVCGCFSMLAMLAYLKAHPDANTTHPRWMILASVMAVLAMLSMPGAVMLPFLFLLIDWYPARRFASAENRREAYRNSMLEKVPLIAVSIGLMVVAVVANQNRSNTALLAADPAWARISQAGHGIWWYLVQTIAPYGVSAFYPRPELGFLSARFVIAVALAVVATVAALAFARRAPWLSAAWLAYVVTLSPHLGLIRVGNTIAADRYCYLAMIVWMSCSRHGPHEDWRDHRTARLAAAIGVCLDRVGPAAGHGLRHAHAVPVVSLGEPVSLWTQAVKRSPRSADARMMRATALSEASRFKEASEEFDRVLAIRPAFAPALVKRGVAQAGMGDFTGAIASYHEGLERDPNNANASMNLGAALAHVGRLDDAITRYERAIELQPKLAEAYELLGTAKLRQGKTGEAIPAFEEALRIRPWFAQARCRLGVALYSQGSADEAVGQYRAAIHV